MADQVIEHPTYIEHIRHFFTAEDLEHMLDWRLDMTTYAGLRTNANSIWQITQPPNATMPPDPARRWSAERSQTFFNWWTDDFPLGSPQPKPPQAGTGSRIRKDARELSTDEVETLRQAFQGIMDKAPDDEGSYFRIAGKHWLPIVPGEGECMHHVDGYHPWHRVYLHEFEDALRSIPGCADVTLPYWDVTDAPPAFLFTEPFASYTLPRTVGDDVNYPPGYVTSRFSSAEIMANLAAFEVPQKIQVAMAEFDWDLFCNGSQNGPHNGIEGGGHDNGHSSCGPTIAAKDVAAFDPLFWFFHSNWDRLWWEWQQAMEATTLWTFRSTITNGQTQFLVKPANALKPFTTRTDEVIDLAATGVGYTLPIAPVEDVAVPPMGPRAFGSIEASRRFRVRSGGTVSVRLKGIDRLAIPGSFQAVLLADGEPISRQAFFQSTEPRACGTCLEQPIVSLSFAVPVEAVLDRDLTAAIEVAGPVAERTGRRFPLSRCGDPTLNVRMLLVSAS